MNAYSVRSQKDGLTLKLWRGERMCLLGFDVKDPEPDFVGFAVDWKGPDGRDWVPLYNRLAFSYNNRNQVPTGARSWPTNLAPIQKFRWLHFPWDVKDGKYSYRVTKIHMPSDNHLISGTSTEGIISLAPITYPGFLDIGFTRNFASSQAFNDRVKKLKLDPNKLIPIRADDGLEFMPEKQQNASTGIYQWLGFESYDLLLGFLEEAVNDQTITLDVLAFDLNEPDVVEQLIKLGKRLRIVIDDSKSHRGASTAETQAANKLEQAGAKVERGHFKSLQHHKVMIAKRNGKAFKIIAGSTNFSFRGLYIQANNLLLFSNKDIAELFEKMFELAFNQMDKFNEAQLAQQWHKITPDNGPSVEFCFSPHQDTSLSLDRVSNAINQAYDAVFYAVAFLGQTKSGSIKAALSQLMERNVFSYGVSDKRGGMTLNKPDGSQGQVDFAYLAQKAPEPFSSEWSGGKGINIHHKFVVTDFNRPTAAVFTGSCNMSPSGESNNGDHLVMIQDQRVATAYALEALRIFDHLHFRDNLKVAKAARTMQQMVLQKPVAISGASETWFDPYYRKNTQKFHDRQIFSE